MKLIIASDIHGSLTAAQALAQAVERHQPDRLLLLGDLLYQGPRNVTPADYDPGQVIPLLNSLKDIVLAVRGNCDSEVDQMVLSFPITADFAWLITEKATLFATHGHVYDPDTWPLRPGEYFVSGHTHVAGRHEAAGHICLNPGSMGIPKGGTPAGYMTFDGLAFRWHRLNGEIYDTLEL